MSIENVSGGSTIDIDNKNNNNKKDDSKFLETMFLGTIAGMGLLAGFSQGISLAKKKDEKSFNKGLMMINERPNMPQMESGARFAMRALGWGTVWAVAGVGTISAAIWFWSGATNLKDFRQKMGEKLPKIPRNPEPQGRTEFESFRDLFTYLAEESAEKRNKKESQDK